MNFLMDKISKIKTQGMIRTIEVQFNRVVPPWVFRYSKGDIYELDTPALKQTASALPSDENLEVICLAEGSTKAERERLREFTWNSVPYDTTLNDLGYAIVDKRNPEQFLGGLWAAVGGFSEHNLGIEFQFSAEQAWLYCAFVDGNARGRGIYKRLISYVASDLETRGFRQLLGIVQPWNRISRAMHEKCSIGIVGTMSAVRMGPFVWIGHAGNLDVGKRLVTSPTASPAQVSISQECWKRMGEDVAIPSTSTSG